MDPKPEPRDINNPDMTDEVKKKKLDILKQMQDILASFGYKEGDIPITNNYWVLLNQYRLKEPV